jgi:hypothetical protein
MSTASELIWTVESAGGRFMIDGDQLGIVPRDAAVGCFVKLDNPRQALQ